MIWLTSRFPSMASHAFLISVRASAFSFLTISFSLLCQRIFSRFIQRFQVLLTIMQFRIDLLSKWPSTLLSISGNLSHRSSMSSGDWKKTKLHLDTDCKIHHGVLEVTNAKWQNNCNLNDKVTFETSQQSLQSKIFLSLLKAEILLLYVKAMR